jgi:hypothetical protein
VIGTRFSLDPFSIHLHAKYVRLHAEETAGLADVDNTEKDNQMRIK